MSGLRLHLAVLNSTISPPDIQMALIDWEEINKDSYKWATFNARQFTNTRVVYVDWGVVYPNGHKETAIQTITYTLRKDGTVDVTKHTHS